jgi:hypothetical protein
MVVSAFRNEAHGKPDHLPGGATVHVSDRLLLRYPTMEHRCCQSFVAIPASIVYKEKKENNVMKTTRRHTDKTSKNGPEMTGEHALSAVFGDSGGKTGDQYRDYMSRVPMLFPLKLGKFRRDAAG